MKYKITLEEINGMFLLELEHNGEVLRVIRSVALSQKDNVEYAILIHLFSEMASMLKHNKNAEEMKK